GSRYYETPNIDILASEGMVFTNAYSAAANCAPSRASMFSGQWAARTGIYTVNSSKRGNNKNRKLIPVPNQKYLDSKVLTFTQILQSNGYATCNVGKWHISKNPKDFGFDVNYGGAEYGHPPAGYFSPWHIRTLKDGSKGTYLTDKLTDLAIKFLKKHKKKPFFLTFATYAVHTTLQAKPELEKKFEQKKGSYEQSNPTYAAMIKTMDTNVGRLINYLKESGKYKNTFIIFTSDNGGVYGITHQWPLRGGKGTYYEGGIRIPMIIVWPDKVKTGTSVDQVVTNLDFFPTFLDVANIPKPKTKILDGSSILPLLEGYLRNSSPCFWDFPIYLQSYTPKSQSADSCFRTRPGASVRMGSWVLLQYYENNKMELYNLEMDP